jgi:putative (di)nucleoside polyphosphate hydrolase
VPRALAAGLILTDGVAVVLGHSTGNPQWDLPKGLVEPGEDPWSACVREVAEETGLDVSGWRLEDLGRMPYAPRKDLHLFRAVMRPLPPVETLVCRSRFFDRRTRTMRPELDAFAHVPVDEIDRYTLPSLGALLRRLLS